MLSVSNLSVQFGKRVLFDEVNIIFSQGNCYGVIGANGAGKSTFLKMLALKADPTSGKVILEPGKRMSVLEQNHNAYDQDTVLNAVLKGNQVLFAIKQEIDALYADYSDENAERIGELQRELALAQKRHAGEISELEDQNQTLNAKLSSTERALLQVRKDNTPAVPDKTSPQKAQYSTAPADTWFINIQTFSKQTDAIKLAESLSNSPENIQVQPVSVNGKTLYRVRAEGYADKAEANAAAEALAQDFGLSKPWIGRQGS